jgi:hypothetical protein cdiviTM7_00597
MKRKNKTSIRLVSLMVVAVLLGSMFLSITKIFNQHDIAYAEGLSPADSLLLKTLKQGMQLCFNSDIIRGAEVKASNSYQSTDIFLTESSKYKDDGLVMLPFKYGAGNTVKDGNISCQQLLEGYTVDGSNNIFDTFAKLGGRIAPPYTNDTQSQMDILQKNKFLELVGYKSSGTVAGGAACAVITYTASINYQTSEYQTNRICINPVEANKEGIGIFQVENGTNRIKVEGGESNENLKLGYDPSSDKISLQLKTKSSDRDCDIKPTPIAETKKIGASLKSGKTPNTIFEELGSEISSNPDLLNKATSSGEEFINNISTTCSGKSLKESWGATNISFRDINITPLNNQGGNENEDNSIKEYKRSAEATVDIPGLMNFYVPSYVNEPITMVEKAYFWYYLLKDVYQGLSVDTTLANPCVEDIGAAGQNYLPYYNIAKKKDGEDPIKVQYCILDYATLTHRSGEKIMNEAPEGRVSGITPLDAMQQLSVTDVLGFLQGLRLELPSLCNQDKNFPLCKANPVECAENPDQLGCKELAGNASANDKEEKEGDQAACMRNAGSLGWLICPLLFGLRDTADGIFEHAVTPMLVVHESIVKGLSKTSGEDSTLYQSWSFFRNVANILFVIAMLFVIFSQITGFGIDNYGIKKILPKLIVTAIIVNFSYIICGIIVDVSNMAGDALRGIFENIAHNTTGTPDRSTITQGAMEIITSIAAVAAGSTAIVLPLLSGAQAIAGGSFLAFIFPILAFVGSAALAGIFAMLMLGLRQALIIIMISISPVAFVLYAIPNTNGMFKKWFSLFKTLLILYPVFCFMVGGGFLVSTIIIKSSNEFYMKFIAGLLSIMPYFTVPSMTKNALKGFDGLAGGIANLQQRAGRAGDSLNRRVMGSDLMRTQQQNAQTHKLQQIVGKYKDVDKSKLKPWQQRRLAAAVSALDKDERNRAGLGAAMERYKYNTDPSHAAQINEAEMNALNDTVKSDLISSYKSGNLSNDGAIAQLNTAVGYDYSTGTVEANRDNDNRIRALSSYLASTKDGQKALDKYMGKSEGVDRGNSSKRAMAVMGRNMVDNHANLRDKYQVAFDQFDNMRGSGKIESMTDDTNGKAKDGQTLNSGFDASLKNVVKSMDLDDLNKLGKQDFEKFYKVNDDGSTGLTFQSDTNENEYRKLQGLADARIKQLKSDTTLISGLSDEEKKFLKAYSTGNVDASTISNVLYMKDAGGTVTGTIEQS